MNANFRIEEISTLGDFVMTSYTRDFNAIQSKFSKLDAAFRDAFTAKLAFIKHLESSLILTEAQKNITASLYMEARRLNEELSFLSQYFVDANLNAELVSDLKHDLNHGNIEGAILKIEGVKQFVVVNQAVLTEQGMAADFGQTLEDYQGSLEGKNALQNEYLNHRKELTSRNRGHYTEMLKMIKQVIQKGKLVFKGTVYQDEYTATKLIQRMRAAKRKEVGGGA